MGTSVALEIPSLLHFYLLKSNHDDVRRFVCDDFYLFGICSMPSCGYCGMSRRGIGLVSSTCDRCRGSASMPNSSGLCAQPYCMPYWPGSMCKSYTYRCTCTLPSPTSILHCPGALSRRIVHESRSIKLIDTMSFIRNFNRRALLKIFDWIIFDKNVIFYENLMLLPKCIFT